MLLPLLLGLGGAGLWSTSRHLAAETAFSENIDLHQIARALYTQPLASSYFDLGRSVMSTNIEYLQILFLAFDNFIIRRLIDRPQNFVCSMSAAELNQELVYVAYREYFRQD